VASQRPASPARATRAVRLKSSTAATKRTAEATRWRSSARIVEKRKSPVAGARASTVAWSRKARPSDTAATTQAAAMARNTKPGAAGTGAEMSRKMSHAPARSSPIRSKERDVGSSQLVVPAYRSQVSTIGSSTR
jgi:hypothetical protein